MTNNFGSSYLNEEQQSEIAQLQAQYDNYQNSWLDRWKASRRAANGGVDVKSPWEGKESSYQSDNLPQSEAALQMLRDAYAKYQPPQPAPQRRVWW